MTGLARKTGQECGTVPVPPADSIPRVPRLRDDTTPLERLLDLPPTS